MVLVYGTKGTVKENEWSMRRAGYDAEAFWYRGNGSVDVVADVDLDDAYRSSEAGKPVAGEGGRTHRNVILYGNNQTNAAWARVLGDCPIDVGSTAVRVVDREIAGDNLAVLFLRPRAGDPRALVGVVGGTGLTGMKLTDRLPYFVSGVGVPDWVVLSPDLLTKGAAGVKGAGFFGVDWKVESGESVWQE